MVAGMTGATNDRDSRTRGGTREGDVGTEEDRSELFMWAFSKPALASEMRAVAAVPSGLRSIGVIACHLGKASEHLSGIAFGEPTAGDTTPLTVRRVLKVALPVGIRAW